MTSERQAAQVEGGAFGRVRRLALSDFRSYAQLDLVLDGRPVTFAGPNGAGKTNIIEALSLLGPGRGLRGAPLAELSRKSGQGGWAASAVIEGAKAGLRDETRLGAGADPAAPDRRACRVDGESVGPTALADHIRFLWLTPAQDRLFMEGASERRRFLDRMTLAHQPAHGRNASAYERAMRARQRLLDEGSRDDNWLEALETQMAEAGVAVAAARRDMAARLAAGAVEAEAIEATFPEAVVALDGLLEAALADAPAADVEDDFARRLRGNRRRDAEAGRAKEGPHRTDLLVTHHAKGQPARLCSTGEQKALLVGLVLANARALTLQPDGAPLILLLDEIAAHFDPQRRAALYDILEVLDFQAFMTGADPDLFDAWGGRAQHFAVEDGGAREISAPREA